MGDHRCSVWSILGHVWAAFMASHLLQRPLPYSPAGLGVVYFASVFNPSLGSIWSGIYCRLSCGETKMDCAACSASAAVCGHVDTRGVPCLLCIRAYSHQYGNVSSNKFSAISSSSNSSSSSSLFFFLPFSLILLLVVVFGIPGVCCGSDHTGQRRECVDVGGSVVQSVRYQSHQCGDYFWHCQHRSLYRCSCRCTSEWCAIRRHSFLGCCFFIVFFPLHRGSFYMGQLGIRPTNTVQTITTKLCQRMINKHKLRHGDFGTVCFEVGHSLVNVSLSIMYTCTCILNVQKFTN
mmetsp:Transcript_28757/g.48252  ORF Transcript_28757/g.48252 Transcript_28757/m.48252 type:complete len:292 (+) Transcript_28757:988-1863(+)